MAGFDDEDDVFGELIVTPGGPDDDASVDYVQALEGQAKADEDQLWNELIGNAPAAQPTGRMSGDLAEELGAEPRPDQPLEDQFAAAQPTSPEDVAANRSAVGAVLSDVGRGVVEAPSQVVGGMADAFGEAGQLLGEITGIGGVQFFDESEDGTLGDFNPQYHNFEEFQEAGGDSLINALSTNDPESATGGFIRATAQFLTGFIPALKGTKALGMTGQFASAMTAGAVADMVVFDPHEDRLSTFLNEIPALEPYVSDYLADNDPANESSWEGRLKNAIEGAGLGLATDGVSALFRAFRYYKVQRQSTAAANFAPEAPSVQAQAGRDALQQAAREELVQEVPDAALFPLGRPDGPLITPVDLMDGDSNSVQAYLRTIDAEDRAAVSIERNDALGRITAASEAAQVRLGADTPEDALGTMLDALRSGDTPSAGSARPVTAILKGLGGVDPASGFAAELRNLGITSRTHPGLFRRGGLSNFDNIPAGDIEVFSARQLDDGNGYVPEQSFIEAMSDEVAGNPWRTLDEDEAIASTVQPLEDLAEELRRLDLDPAEMSNATIRENINRIIDEEDALSREFAPRDGADEASEIVIERVSINDIHGGEAFGYKELTSNGVPSAAADVNILDDVVSIRDIVVRDEARRQGFATRLVDDLIEEFPDHRIEVTGMTEDGAAFFPSRYVLETTDEGTFIVGKTERGSTTATLEDTLDAEMPDSARPEAEGAAPPRVFINHARINAPEDVRAVLQEMAELDANNIEDATRGVVTNEQTIRESSQEYRDLDDLIGRPPGPMSAAQAVAARRLLTSSGEQIVELARRAQAAEATPADLFNFRRAMAVHYSIQSEVIAARTETARALQSWNIPTGSSPARSQAITDLIMHNGGAGDLQSLARAVSNVGENPTALNTMARELGRGRFGKAMYQVWINGILSSPKTHMVNVLSNAATAMWAIPERMVASGISRAFYDGQIDTSEIASMAFGFTKGARDGIRMIWHGNNADGVSDLGQQFTALGRPEVHTSAVSAEAFGMNPAGAFGRAMDFMGKITDLPGRALQGEDVFFKSMGYRMQLNALAARTASSEGLEGEAWALRVAEVLADPPASLTAEAVDFAAVQTFTNRLGPLGQKGMSFVRSVPGGSLVMPFIQTPTNIIKYTFARTPLAYLSTNIRSQLRAGGAKAAEAHARVATGSMLMLAMADMTLDGTIVGGGPTDPNVRRAWLSDGNLPYSVKINGRSYQYSRLDPIGLLMGLAADIATISTQATEDESAELVTAGVTALASNLASKTYLRSVFDFIGAIDPSNPMKSADGYINNFSGSLLPYSSFIRNVAGTGDPIMRDTRDVVRGEDGDVRGVATFLNNMVNRVRAGIPGLSDDLPPRRDLFGEEINRSSEMGAGFDFLSPIASRVNEDDPVIRVIVDNNIRISNVPRNIQGVTLSAEQYSEFSRLAGQPLKEHLDQLVASPGFQRLSDGPDGMKAEVVRNAVNSFREQARALMMRQYPELQRLSYQRQLERAQILQGGN